MTNKIIAEKCNEIALNEIEIYGLPTLRHYNLSMEAAVRIAEEVGVDVELTKAGVSLMDIKLGQSAKEGRQTEHVKLSSEFAKKILSDLGVDSSTFDLLINCVEAHHGKIPFNTKIAEVVANADCYRFIHPIGVMSFHATNVKRGKNHNECLQAVKAKMDEKKAILSLDFAKSELLPYYDMFSEIIEKAQD